MIKLHFHSVQDTDVFVHECNELGYPEPNGYELWHFTDEEGNVRDLLIDPATGEGWILNG